MINEDLMLMFTIRGFLLANKEEDLAESLKLFVNRHPEIFEDKPIITGPVNSIPEPDIETPAENEGKIKFRKNFKTVEMITADNSVIPLKKKRFLHRDTPVIQKFNGMIVKTWKSQKELCKKLGYSSPNISKAANYGGKAYGFTWEWKK